MNHETDEEKAAPEEEMARPTTGCRDHAERLMTKQEFHDYVEANYADFRRTVAGSIWRPEDADEIVQVVLLKLLLRHKQIDPANPGGYFFATGRKEAKQPK